MHEALTVAGLMVALEAMIAKDKRVADLPVVLASDAEANVASPVALEYAVSFGCYRHVDRGRGTLGGDDDNCIVIWPAD